jgi:hypothetical protein
MPYAICRIPVCGLYCYVLTEAEFWVVIVIAMHTAFVKDI